MILNFTCSNPSLFEQLLNENNWSEEFLGIYLYIQLSQYMMIVDLVRASRICIQGFHGNLVFQRKLRVSMGLTDRRKTAKNLVDSRKNGKILTVSRKWGKKN